MLVDLKKYLDFRGRAGRKEFWLFFLFSLLAQFPAGLLDALLFRGAPILAAITFLALVPPSIAVATRRLHDQNLSGWWLLIGLFPGLGVAALLLFYVFPGTLEANRFGPPLILPEGVAEAPAAAENLGDADPTATLSPTA